MDFNVIIEFWKLYGWKLSLLALSGIVILGLLKWIGCFNKLKSNKKKYIYFVISCVLSILSCTIYLLVNHCFDWANYGLLCSAVAVFTFTIYTVYENTGLRAVWKKVVLDNVAKFLKCCASAIVSGSLSQDKLKKLAMNLGSETLAELSTKAKALEESKKTNDVATEEVQQ